MHGYANNCAYQVAEHQVAGLCERAVGSTKHQYRRGAKGADQKNAILVSKPALLKETYQTYAKESSDKSPEMIYGFNNSLPVNYISRYPV
jgi:hypothetical protein